MHLLPVKIKRTLISLCLVFAAMIPRSYARGEAVAYQFDFFGEPVSFTVNPAAVIDFTDSLSTGSIQHFYQSLNAAAFDNIISSLQAYRQKHNPDDWLFYQLIRKTTQQISPKLNNYNRYTLYKWYLLTRTGFGAILTIAGNKMLFYVQSNEHIYNIPSRLSHGRQYVCLNFHDYKNIDPVRDHFEEVPLPVSDTARGFSYKVTQLPDFTTTSYQEKDLKFNYYQSEYNFKVRVNPEVKTLFANYPVVDYEYYFNIPMSRETYRSLIPALRGNVAAMNVKNGVDYLMRFTRYAFLFQPDNENFGTEKRLSPEQTLLYDQSDCEDRAALFFYLVKEIYNLPMLVLSYPQHVTIAVQFDKPVGKTIEYNGRKYTICEPTPQKDDLALGEMLPSLRKTPYEIAYAYLPKH